MCCLRHKTTFWSNQQLSSWEVAACTVSTQQTCFTTYFTSMLLWQGKEGFGNSLHLWDIILPTSYSLCPHQEQVVITLDLITSAWCSEQRSTTYSCSVMMAIEWRGHMCGSALYEFLMVMEPGRGGFIRKNRWAGKEGGSHQAEKALLDVSLWQNELQTSGNA